MTWTSASVPAKDDITNAYAYAKKNADGDLILYVGIEREDPSGDSHVDVEFFQKNVTPKGVDPSTGKCVNIPGSCTFDGSNTDGDLLVNMDFSRGGGFGTLTVRERAETLNKNHYTDPLGVVDHEGCNSADTLCAVNNGSPVNTATWIHRDNHGAPITFIPPNGFTEFGINVKKLTGRNDLCFATFMVKTRSSSSFTAELKDFAAVAFEKCEASVVTEIHKGSSGDPNHSTTDIQKDVGIGTVPSQTVVHDKAIVTGTEGATEPTGTVTFTRFDNSTCDRTDSSEVHDLGTKNLATQPNGTTTAESDDYTTSGDTPNISFEAKYNGLSGIYDPVTSVKCEVLSVSKGSTGVTTTIKDSGGKVVLNTAIDSTTPGTTIHDVATVTPNVLLKDNNGDAILPTGTVTFTLFSDASCTTPVPDNDPDPLKGNPETVTLSGGDTTTGAVEVSSSEQTPTLGAANFQSYKAQYSGDSNYGGSEKSSCEPICAFPFLK